ncbi:MAG: hypothetical protein KDB53_15215, partial [Planctomycetes bacterium]|nr:hypothetical protein [Planctomycetota bacterium]
MRMGMTAAIAAFGLLLGTLPSCHLVDALADKGSERLVEEIFKAPELTPEQTEQLVAQAWSDFLANGGDRGGAGAQG